MSALPNVGIGNDDKAIGISSFSMSGPRSVVWNRPLVLGLDGTFDLVIITADSVAYSLFAPRNAEKVIAVFPNHTDYGRAQAMFRIGMRLGELLESSKSEQIVSRLVAFVREIPECKEKKSKV